MTLFISDLGGKERRLPRKEEPMRAKKIMWPRATDIALPIEEMSSLWFRTVRRCRSVDRLLPLIVALTALALGTVALRQWLVPKEYWPLLVTSSVALLALAILAWRLGGYFKHRKEELDLAIHVRKSWVPGLAICTGCGHYLLQKQDRCPECGNEMK